MATVGFRVQMFRLKAQGLQEVRVRMVPVKFVACGLWGVGVNP